MYKYRFFREYHWQKRTGWFTHVFGFCCRGVVRYEETNEGIGREKCHLHERNYEFTGGELLFNGELFSCGFVQCLWEKPHPNVSEYGKQVGETRRSSQTPT